MAKRQSKRLTTRRRVKIEKKIREHNSKVRKTERKAKSSLAKIPRSVLMTDEDKMHLEEIKRIEKERNEAALKEVKEYKDPIFSKLDEPTDLYIQVLDGRDIKGSRCVKIENYLKDRNLKSYIVRHGLENIDTEGLDIIKDLEDLKKVIMPKVCIFGNPKTGKYTLSKEIEKINPDVKVSIVRAPFFETNAASVLRGLVDVQKVDGVTMFTEVYPFIDHAALREFYRIRNYDCVDSCLDLLAQKLVNLAAYRTKRAAMEGGAGRFFKDVIDNKILWYKVGEQYAFKFS